MEEERAEARPEKRCARGEAGEDRHENRRAEHREHVLNAEHRHLRDAERAGVVDRLAGPVLVAQTGDGTRKRRRFVGRDDAVFGNRDQELFEKREVVVLRRKRMDEAYERLRLVYVGLSVRERELLRSRNELRNHPGTVILSCSHCRFLS